MSVIIENQQQPSSKVCLKKRVGWIRAKGHLDEAKKYASLTKSVGFYFMLCVISNFSEVHNKFARSH